MNTITDLALVGWFVAAMIIFVGIIVWGWIGMLRIDWKVTQRKTVQKKLEDDFIDAAEATIVQLKQLSESKGIAIPMSGKSGRRSPKRTPKPYSYLEEPEVAYGVPKETLEDAPQDKRGWVLVASSVIALLEFCKRDEIISKIGKDTINKLEADFMARAEALVRGQASMDEDVAALHKLLTESYQQGSVFAEAASLIQLRKRLRASF